MNLSGVPIAEKIKQELANTSIQGKLAIVQVENDPVSSLYVRKKQEFAEELGFDVVIRRPSAESLKKEILELKNSDDIKGIIIQLPLPQSINKEEVLSEISSDKDVDGFRYILGKDFKVYPPTILAVYEVMKWYHIPLDNGVLIVGGGFLVGKPLKKFLESKKIVAEILEKDDPNYEYTLKSYDVVVVATGGGRHFRQTEFKKGAYVIDASTVAEENKLKGDVETVGDHIHLSGVPGGVGPITVAMLFKNFSSLNIY